MATTRYIEGHLGHITARVSEGARSKEQGMSGCGLDNSV